MISTVQNLIAQTGIVGQRLGGQFNGVREIAVLRQAFAFQRLPHAFHGKPTGVARHDHIIAKMKMIAMRLWNRGHAHRAMVAQCGDQKQQAAQFVMHAMGGIVIKALDDANMVAAHGGKRAYLAFAVRKIAVFQF